GRGKPRPFAVRAAYNAPQHRARPSGGADDATWTVRALIPVKSPRAAIAENSNKAHKVIAHVLDPSHRTGRSHGGWSSRSQVRLLQREGSPPVHGRDRGLGHHRHGGRRADRRPAVLADARRGGPVAELRPPA